MTPPFRIPPPTIADLREMGITGPYVTCLRSGCNHTCSVAWEALRLPEATRFPKILHARRFVCQKCGGDHISIMPDWKGYSEQQNRLRAERQRGGALPHRDVSSRSL